MDCYFINLDRATARRATLERNFRLCAKPGWKLTRFPAIDTQHVAAVRTPGVRTAGEKATYLSHRTLIGLQRGRLDPAMILEDDARFGPRTCQRIESFFRRPQAPAWDIIFADVILIALSAMVELARYRNRLAASDQVALLDLRQFRFAGASAYLVNPASAEKVYALLSARDTIDLPIDVAIERLVHGSQLAAFTFFPFLTTLSAQSYASQVRRIGPDTKEYLWNLFTRMMWIDRDLDEVERLRSHIDTTWMTEGQRNHFAEILTAFDSGL